MRYLNIRHPIMICYSLAFLIILVPAVGLASELESDIDVVRGVAGGSSQPRGLRLGIETTHPSERIDTSISLSLPVFRRSRSGDHGRNTSAIGVQNVLVAVPATYVARGKSGIVAHDLTLGLAVVVQIAGGIRFATIAQGRVIDASAAGLSFVGIANVPAGARVTLIGGAAYLPDSPQAVPAPLIGVAWTPSRWLYLQVLAPARVELSVAPTTRLSATFATGLAPDPGNPNAGPTATSSASIFVRATSQLVFGLEGRLGVPLTTPSSSATVADQSSTTTIALSLTVTPAVGTKR